MYPDTERGDEAQEAAGATQGVVRCPPLPSATSAQQQHCPASQASTDLGRICITVAPFTGGPFEVNIYKSDTIEELKKLIARRLKVAKERIYLLYRESELLDGSVTENLLVDGSTVTLLPRAETGLINPKPEQSVMQALESLNEQQVNDFLSGAAPLNLTMRLGDHMMLIQLQLSTVNQLTSQHHSSSSRRHKSSSIQISSSPSTSLYSSSSSSSSSRSSHHQHSSSSRGSYPSSSRSNSSSSSATFPSSRSNSSSSSSGLGGATINGLHLPGASLLTPPPSSSIPTPLQRGQAAPSSGNHHLHQTSQKSTTQKVRIPLLSPGGLLYNNTTSSSSTTGVATANGDIKTSLGSAAGSLFPPPATQSLKSGSSKSTSFSSAPATVTNPQHVLPPSQQQQRSTSGNGPSASNAGCEPPLAKKPKLDTRALAEASKNLTQTLKQLSSEVLTTQPESTNTTSSNSSASRQNTAQSKPKREEKSRKRRHAASSSSSGHHHSSGSSSSSSGSTGSSGSQSAGSSSSSSSSSNRGAIIESMHHHGKGVYSGTFSGTLNPALQDANGQPKRDITTIVHILNDLLCAQYKAYSSGSSGSSHRSSRHHRSHHGERSAAHGSGHHHGHHHHSAAGKQQAADQTERELSEQQLNITRTKMEALKRIMEERRAKREARKQQAQARTARSYSTAWSVKPEPKSVDASAGAVGNVTGATGEAAATENEQFLQQPEPVTA